MTTTQTTVPIITTQGVEASVMVQERLHGMDNYRIWKFTIKMALVHEGLYNCVTRIDTEEECNQAAIAQIVLCVEPQCYVHLADVQTTKEVWEKLEKKYTDKGLF
jgi:hypothetical protein